MDKQEKQEIGRRVRALRKARELTQQELADATGLSLGAVGGLERGVTLPQPENRRAIAVALGEDVFGDGIEQDLRDSWDPDVRGFANALGLYLQGLGEQERAAQIAKWMGEILAARGDGGVSR